MNELMVKLRFLIPTLPEGGKSSGAGAAGKTGADLSDDTGGACQRNGQFRCFDYPFLQENGLFRFSEMKQAFANAAE